MGNKKLLVIMSIINQKIPPKCGLLHSHSISESKCYSLGTNNSAFLLILSPSSID